VPSIHPTDADIERFHRRQLPASGLVSLADHLTGCDRCRHRLAAWSDPTAATASLEIGLGLDEDAQFSEPKIHIIAPRPPEPTARLLIVDALAAARLS